MKRILVWFRGADLRVHDNGLLTELNRFSSAVEVEYLPVFVFDPFFFNRERCSEARFCWISDAVFDLHQTLSKFKNGKGLHVVSNVSSEVAISSLVDRFKLTDVWFFESWLPEEAALEQRVQKALPKTGFKKFPSPSQLFDATQIDLKKLPHSFSKFRFGVASSLSVPQPLPSPPSLPPAIDGPEYFVGKQEESKMDKRSALCGLQSGERGALDRLERYLGGPANTYHKTRNGMVGAAYSTKFSVFFAVGALSPRLAWHRTQRLVKQSKDARACPRTALELEFLWAEYFHLLQKSLSPVQFFGWESLRGQKPPVVVEDKNVLEKWQRGETGNPFVDANMKELVATGFMSNRGRQNAASYLIFDLKQDWRKGAAFFEKYLFDHCADVNSGNWKYIAGCLTDVRDTKFDVEQQRKRYDADGRFVKLWTKA